MTTADRLIPFWVRFQWGFGYISILMGLVSFGMSIVTMITVKGIYIPLWTIPIVATMVLALCTMIGYYFEKYDIQNRISSHSNQNANPEFVQMIRDIKEIKEMLKKS